MPKFLAFALIPIVLFANVKVSNDDFLKREVKCSNNTPTKNVFRVLQIIASKAKKRYNLNLKGGRGLKFDTITA